MVGIEQKKPCGLPFLHKPLLATADTCPGAHPSALQQLNTVPRTTCPQGADPTVVTCTTPGTRYTDAAGDNDSPDCGHTYTTTSVDRPDQAYPVTATTTWNVTWTATTGATGTIPLTLTTTPVPVRIGELQVIVTG